MLRPVFRTSLGKLAGAIVVPVLALARASAQRIPLQSSPVAGFRYHAEEQVWPALAVGVPLTLVREPENPHDERAVRIDWNGHKLGYVPRVENTMISNLIDQGLSVQARIARLRGSHDPWRRVEISWYEH